MKRLLAILVAICLASSAVADVTVISYSTGGAAGGVTVAGPNTFTGANSFLDNDNFTLKNTSDPTKTGIFNLAAIATGMKRTYALPNVSSTIAVSGIDNAFSVAQTFANGTEAAPSISFASDTGLGFYRVGPSVLGLSVTGVIRTAVINTGFQVSSIGQYGWSSTTPGASGNDTIISREVAAGVQFGADINGTAVDQTLSAADAITGADISGADFTFQSGSGQGIGTVSALIFQTPTVAAAGANVQALATRLTVSSAGVFAKTFAALSGPPTVSACGTTPSAVTGTNLAGKLTTGSGGTVQSCTITFVPAFTTAPACTCTNETNILLVRGTTTTTTLVCDSAVAGTLESDVISYVCLGGS